MLVWQRRHIWSYGPWISQNFSWWFDWRVSTQHQKDILVCLPNGMWHPFMQKRISLITLLPAQLLVVESLHTRHYIHHDIKPGNFMVWTDNLPPTVFLINFGLARQFCNPATYLLLDSSTPRKPEVESDKASGSTGGHIAHSIITG